MNSGCRFEDLAGTDRDLADLRRRLTGSCITVAAFLDNGNSVVMHGIHDDTISFFVQDGVQYLRLSNGIRSWVVPNVQYWTEE